MQSGDEATRNLRNQLKKLEEDFEAFKKKAKSDYEDMQALLNEKNKRELDALREKYERMIQELKMNANSDKEFMQSELKKQIAELERQIMEMREQFAREKEALMGG